MNFTLCGKEISTPAGSGMPGQPSCLLALWTPLVRPIALAFRVDQPAVLEMGPYRNPRPPTRVPGPVPDLRPTRLGAAFHDGTRTLAGTVDFAIDCPMDKEGLVRHALFHATSILKPSPASGVSGNDFDAKFPFFVSWPDPRKSRLPILGGVVGEETGRLSATPGVSR